MTKTFFVTGTGTGVGKTYVTCALIRHVMSEGKRVLPFKPLVSGQASDGNYLDTTHLLSAAEIPLNEASINQCSPWRFKEPLAPIMAAKHEGRTIDYDELIEWCHMQFEQTTSDTVLIEGAGGLMSPVTETTTHIDWIKALEVPIILVASNYLGSISHLLTAITSCNAYGIKIHHIVINEVTKDGVNIQEMLEVLTHHIDRDLISVMEFMASQSIKILIC